MNWFMIVVAVLHFMAAAYEVKRGNAALCTMFVCYGVAAVAIATQGGV